MNENERNNARALNLGHSAEDPNCHWYTGDYRGIDLLAVCPACTPSGVRIVARPTALQSTAYYYQGVNVKKVKDDTEWITWLVIGTILGIGLFGVLAMIVGWV